MRGSNILETWKCKSCGLKKELIQSSYNSYTKGRMGDEVQSNYWKVYSWSVIDKCKRHDWEREAKKK